MPDTEAAKVVVHIVLEAQQWHHHVGHLIGELVGLILGAVAVLGRELAVLAFGEYHLILVVLVAAGVVEDLGVVFFAAEDALPELPDAPQPTRASSMTPAIRQAMIRFIFNLSFRSQGEIFGVQ
jgi:hypothetical protein